MKNFQLLGLACLCLTGCQKETSNIEPPIPAAAIQFAGSTRDTTHTVDFATGIRGRLDTVHRDENGKMAFTISAYEKQDSSYFLAIRLLTHSTGAIATGEYYLTPDLINDEAFGFTTTKGVGRFEHKGSEAGTLQVWTGSAWETRADWVKITVEKSEAGYLSGVFSGSFTRTEVVYGNMKMSFSGRFDNVKVEY